MLWGRAMEIVRAGAKDDLLGGISRRGTGTICALTDAMAILCLCWITLSFVLCVAVTRAAGRPLPKPAMRQGTAASERGRAGERAAGLPSADCIRNSKCDIPSRHPASSSALAPCGEA